MFGLNAARQPDGFAEAALLLGDYRKLDPVTARGADLLRPSERPDPNSRRDAMEGQPAAVAAVRSA